MPTPSTLSNGTPTHRPFTLPGWLSLQVFTQLPESLDKMKKQWALKKLYTLNISTYLNISQPVRPNQTISNLIGYHCFIWVNDDSVTIHWEVSFHGGSSGKPWCDASTSTAGISGWGTSTPSVRMHLYIYILHPRKPPKKAFGFGMSLMSFVHFSRHGAVF